jgi:hypothetical protein
VHVLAGISRDDLAIGANASYQGQYDSDAESLASNNSYGVAVGGGLDISITKEFAIRAIQADYYLTNHKAQPLDSSSGNKMFSNVNMSFGVVYRFGK